MPRLIDLHTNWLLQYAAETTVFDPTLYPDAARALAQCDGYLGATQLAFLSCHRTKADWASRSDPWQALNELVTRLEAEFSGRLIHGRDDFGRWIEDSNGLAWGILGVSGFDFLIRSTGDLDRLHPLYERGVRLFRLADGEASLLGGTTDGSGDRGLSDLGRAFLETLLELSNQESPSRPLVDLAHLNSRTTGDVLDWFESEPSRQKRLIPVHSHGGLLQGPADTPGSLTLEPLSRLRAMGGVVGITPDRRSYRSFDDLKSRIEQVAAIPFQGTSGYDGITIGSDFLSLASPLPGMGNADEVIASLKHGFPKPVASAITQGNARKLIERMIEPA